MEDLEQSSPDELEPTEVPESEGQETDQEEAGQSDDQAEDVSEVVEIERNGKRYSIPKDLEGELLMQGDYTRKTQELSEQRKALEAQRAQLQQVASLSKEQVKALGELSALDAQLEQANGIDWNALTQEDPAQAQKVFMHVQALREQRQQKAQAVAQAEQQAAQMRQHQMLSHLNQAREQLVRDIPGFDRPETKQALMKHGEREGFRPEELSQVADPRAVRLLWKAMKYDELTAKAKKVEAKPAPVAPVLRAKTPERAPEQMSTSEWMAWRNKQLRSKR